MSRETRVIERTGAARRWALGLVLATAIVAPLGCGGEEDGGTDGGSDGGTPAEAARPTLAEGWFKENCAMGFEIHGATYTEWADALKQVVELRGEIVNAPDLTAERGVLVLRITEGTEAYPAGRYTVVRWSDFHGATVEKRVAARGTDDATRATAEAALAELTAEDGWFEEFCCPFAVHYAGPRLTGAWTVAAGRGGFTLARVTTAGGSVFQYTERDGDAVRVQGTVDRTSDLTAQGGYLRVQVTDGGTAGLTAGEYTVVAWRQLEAGRVEAALAQAGGRYATVADKGQAHRVFTVEAGSFTFRTFTR